MDIEDYEQSYSQPESMYMQQKLTFQAATKRENEQDEEEQQDQIDIFVGTLSPLLDPFNIFVRVKDIESDNPQVYFYCYSLGKAKVIIWGVYDKDNDQFYIDDACVYNLKYLAETLKIWEGHGYKYAANQTKNRFNKRIAMNIIYDKSIKEAEKLFNDYKDLISYYYFLETINEDIPFKINEKILEKFVEDNPTHEFIKANLGILKSEAKHDLDKMESKIRKMAPSSDYGEEYLQIRNHAVVLSLENGLGEMYGKIYLFVLIMMDDEEYRAAKYITVKWEKQTSGRFSGRVSGRVSGQSIEISMLNMMNDYINRSFVFAWLNHVTGNEELQAKIAEQMVDIYERMVNYSDASKGTELIKKMSTSFMKFIAKTKYSKRNVVKKLKPCYTPQQCENGDCPIFEHGHTLISTYDYDLR